MKTSRIYVMVILVSILLTACDKKEETFPQRRDIVDVVFASGSVIMEKNYLITAQAEGNLVETHFTEGDSINAGQLLFKVKNNTQEALVNSTAAGYQYALNNMRSNSPVWQKLKQQQVQLNNQLKNDSAQYIRYRNLYGINAVSKAEYDKVKLAYNNTQAELKILENTMADTHKSLHVEALNAKAGYVAQQTNNEQYIIKSDYSGVLLSSPKIPGELVKHGDILAQIGAGKFLARLLISENDINKIKLGQEVFIELNTEKNTSHKGIIKKIYPAFDSNEQSFVAETEFAEKSLLVRVGTQLQANIIISESKQALVIPNRFLLSENKIILARTGEQKNVKIGIVTPEWVEIKEGLNENDKIVMLDKNAKKKKK